MISSRWFSAVNFQKGHWVEINSEKEFDKEKFPFEDYDEDNPCCIGRGEYHGPGKYWRVAYCEVTFRDIVDDVIELFSGKEILKLILIFL